MQVMDGVKSGKSSKRDALVRKRDTTLNLVFLGILRCKHANV